jgi:hypothetical protein
VWCFLESIDKASSSTFSSSVGLVDECIAAPRDSTGPVRLITFLAVVLATFVAVQYMIDTGLRRIRTSSFGVFNRIVDGNINATILVTGSSRALTHYDARELTRRTGATAFNIGINGSQTDMQLAVLKTYLRHNTRPALLIHNLDSFAFVTSRQGLAFPDMYLPYLDQPDIYDALKQLDPSWSRARYLPLYGYAVQDMRFSWAIGLAALTGWNPRETRFAGFEPRQRSWSEDFDRFKQAHPEGVSFPIEPEAERQFEQLVSEVASRGTHVLLVYSPVYYEMLPLDRSRAEVLARFEAIAERYGASVWDYSGSTISKNRNLFYNSQHLNAHGAALFSVSLADRLVTSGLLDTQRGEASTKSADSTDSHQ